MLKLYAIDFLLNWIIILVGEIVLGYKLQFELNGIVSGGPTQAYPKFRHMAVVPVAYVKFFFYL